MRLAKASPAPRRRRWPVLEQKRARALWPQQAGDGGHDCKEIQYWKFLNLGKQRELITTYILTGFGQNPTLGIFAGQGDTADKIAGLFCRLFPESVDLAQAWWEYHDVLAVKHCKTKRVMHEKSTTSRCH